MKEEIYELIKDREYVSFAELDRLIDGFRGEQALFFESDPNLILWPSLSEEASSALQELLHEKKIYPHGSSMMLYMVDSLMPQMPVAKRPPKGGYKEPHWAPVTFCVFPPKKRKKSA